MHNTTEQYLSWLKFQGRSRETISNYKIHLRLFRVFLEKQPNKTTEPIHHRIAPDSITDFLAQLKGNGPTKAAYWRSIRAYCNWASHPTRALMPELPRWFKPKFDKAKPFIPPSVEHVRALLDKLPARTDTQRRNRAVFHTLYFLGLRHREALGIEKANVDLDSGIALIYSSKTQRWDPMPIPKPLGLVLCSYFHIPKGRYLFPKMGNQPADKPLSRHTLLETWKNHQRACGVPDHRLITCHDLRHACATHLHAAGGDILDIQSVLRHTSPQMAIHYTKGNPERLRKMMDDIWD